MEKLTICGNTPVIGIDLGTTYCCVAYLNSNQTVEIIENRDGYKTTPSYVAFTEEHPIVGRVAKQRGLRHPANVVYDAKRLIGHKYGDAFLESCVKHNWPFKISSDENQNVCVEITHNGMTATYKPEDISAILLKYMKTIAEEHLDTEVKNAVITVPAHFNYHQRTATKKAGELAGLNIVKIINEPTAAAIAYVHKNKITGEAKNILLFDLGGGTFDVSIVTVKDNSVTVKATAGDTALGGRDFDNNLTEFIATKIENQYKKKIKTNFATMRRIKEQTEKVKIDLSTETKAYFDLPGLIDDKDVEFEITRCEFEEINSHLFKVCMNTVEKCLVDAQLTEMEIDKIVLVGGSTRIPAIQEMLREFFQREQLTKAIHPDEAVAYGAAVQAAMCAKYDETKVNCNVYDVTPLSLGISANKGLMIVIIPRNTKIPTSSTKQFVTSVNNQEVANISIYEGERSLIKHNTLIGNTQLNLPPKPVCCPLSVTFHVNSDGIFEVSAKTTDRNYTSLNIKYENANISETSNILKDAEINSDIDTQFCNILEAWKELHLYNEMMLSICDYDKRGITDKEKTTIKNHCKDVRIWLASHVVKDGHPEEKVAILEQRNEAEKLCEPIVNSYGYHVKDMRVEEFYKMLTK